MTSGDYIAVFDSGLGGISVLRHLRQILPGERYLYFGDAANAPYGSRSTQSVRQLTMAAVEMLFANYPVKALVVACNTATAAAIDQLREKYPERIIIGIEPALKLAADTCPGGRIGVMATEVTLREEKFDHLLHRFHTGCMVQKIPAPGVVELIEQGKGNSAEMHSLLTGLLEPYIGKLDALVLGCTHYPLAAESIADVLGRDVLLLDGGEGTAKETKRRLAAEDLLNSHGDGQVRWMASGDAVAFAKLAQTLL